jgi:hypothetical protein
MPANPADDGFTETKDIPRGRKSRSVPDLVWAKLAESATRNVAFVKTGKPDEVDELRKDLGTAAVRAKYEVTVNTDKVSDKLHKLTFAARAKDTSESEPEPAAATA